MTAALRVDRAGGLDCVARDRVRRAADGGSVTLSARGGEVGNPGESGVVAKMRPDDDRQGTNHHDDDGQGSKSPGAPQRCLSAAPILGGVGRCQGAELAGVSVGPQILHVRLILS